MPRMSRRKRKVLGAVAAGDGASVFVDADVAIFHLTTVAFDPDRPSVRELIGRFQHFAVARASGLVAAHGDHKLVPVLWFVVLEVLVRPREQVVAALQLATADEHAAVS